MQGGNPAEASDLLYWSKRPLALIGIWPKGKYHLRFAFHLTYMCLHVAMEYVDFIEYISDLEHTLDNLNESITFTLVIIKMIVIWKNGILKQLIDAVNDDCANHKSTGWKKRGSSAKYNSIVKNFYKFFFPLVAAAASFYYLTPLAGYLFQNSANGTSHFVLPYRMRFIYEMTEVKRYAAAYAYEAVVVYIVTVGWVGCDGLLVSLTMHVCMELSILADRIVSLRKDARNGNHPAIHSIVRRHIRLIWMAKNIDRVFTVILCAQLTGTALLICLNGFNVILNLGKTQKTSLMTFALCEASVLGLLFSYCFISECLIRESTRLRDALYQCTWYEMPTPQSKNLIICMARCQTPLYLTAGKFYIFSMENFGEVIKLAFTYMSVLRTLV